MIKRGCGQIVTISSVVGKFALPFRAPYSAAKNALNAYMETLRLDVCGCDNIRFHLSTHVQTIPIFPSIHPSMQLSISPSTHPSTHPSIHQSTHPSIHPSSTDPSIQPSTHPSIHSPIHPPVHSPPQPICPAITASVNASASRINKLPCFRWMEKRCLCVTSCSALSEQM